MVEDLVFRVQVFGFSVLGVYGSELRIQGLNRVQVLRFRVDGFEILVGLKEG